ncbi:protein NEN4 isoform X1 [Primulina eburnea]|uniref:protein NEN4 isoform X1 n=1 Tax=Primulina eburnea TaxID=1245227 RepID=UPI003C6CBB30
MVISSTNNGGPSEIVFFDLETTVPTKTGQRFCVLEFGAIVVCPRKLVELDSYCTLIRPRDLSAVASNSGRCDGITRDKVGTAPTFEEVADKIFSILDGRIWAGHNIQRFDCVRIKEAFAEINRPAPVPYGIVDSLGLLTQKFGRRAGNMKMATLAAYFGLGQQKHRSLEDVRLNLEVLKHCATVLLLESSLPSSVVNQRWCSVATRSKSSLGSSKVECIANIRGKSINRKSAPSARVRPYARETSYGKVCSKFHVMEKLYIESGSSCLRLKTIVR